METRRLIVKFSGHPDACWFDPAGNPSDMLVSWRGLTTNMFECIWYGSDKEWRCLVNRAERLQRAFDICAIPPFLEEILSYEIPKSLEAFTFKLAHIDTTPDGLAVWEISRPATRNDRVVPEDDQSTEYLLKFGDLGNSRTARLTTPRGCLLIAEKIKAVTGLVSVASFPPLVIDNGTSMSALEREFSGLQHRLVVESFRTLQCPLM